MTCATNLFLALIASGPKVIADLPLEIIGDKPYLSAVVGGKKIKALIDTGAGTSIADSSIARAFATESPHPIRVKGVGSQELEGIMLKSFDVRLVGSSVSHPVGLAIPLDNVATYGGMRLEVILGYDFLKNYVVQFDYARKRVRFYEAGTFQGENAVAMEVRSNTPVISGQVDLPPGGRQKLDLMIDTGASSALSFTAAFSDRSGVQKFLQASPTVPTGGGTGGLTMGKRTRVKRLGLGSQAFKNVPVNVPQDAEGATGRNNRYDAVVGAETLRRFTLTVDYPGEKIYLQPNGLFGEPFVGDKAGLFLFAEGADLKTIRVHSVLPGSPAGTAGLQKGDRILKVDGKDVKVLGMLGIKDAIRRSRGKMTFLIDRGGKQRTLTMVPKDIL